MIRLDQITKQYGRQILFMETGAAIHRGEKVGLVGPNGAGKSTVFRMITREEAPDDGQISIDRGVTIGHFSQDVGEMSGRSVVTEVMAGAGAVSDVAAELRQLEEAMSDPARAGDMDRIIARYGEVQSRFEDLGGYELEARAREVLAGLGFSDDVMDGDVGHLSGGWKMRVGLARVLLMEPSALLLDEPSNHLDIESLIWLEHFLERFDGALLMTSHDREFLNRVVGRILEIDEGELTSYSGNYDFYESQRAQAELQAEAAYARQQAKLAKEMRFIERFKAQAAKASQVQSRVKQLDKIEKVEPPKKRVAQSFDFPPYPRSGDDVVRIEGLGKRYGTRIIYDGLDLTIRRGERWAVMGVNGAGKSTLLRLVAGESAPDAGSVKLGANVRLGYFAQHAMEVLRPDSSVLQTLEESFPLANGATLRTLAGCFGFPGDDIAKPCRILSGGEKARLVLARILYDRPNFLVLDEPTNHLDMATKDMLVRALAGYEGTMLFVSHDRRFLADLSTRILELGPDGPVVYNGGYREYVAASGHEAPGLR
ncbi:MAG TPA: ABC-F family ATP-binding cassette domain-containing protein [Candidatus Limnocylindrales bacterium]|nr:ABC-F family ATP-binding cassette domain-containing protein [Candidatus Limnocylindrales bacterium]